jgi:CRP-like cAMP-binding protein
VTISSAILSETPLLSLRTPDRISAALNTGDLLHAPNATIRWHKLALPRFIVSGWACQQRISADGRRQIFSILLPGDVLLHDSDSMRSGLFQNVALTEVRTTSLQPSIAGTAEDSEQRFVAVLYEQIVRLRMNSLPRTAHLLLELHRRLSNVGLASGWTFPLPITQEILADALSMTGVHVSRILKQMHRLGLISDVRGEMTILNPPQMVSLVSQY